MSPTTGERIVRTVCIKSWYTNGVRVFLWHLLNASLRKLWQQRWVRHQTAEVGREADETVFSGVEYLLLRSWISCWQPASHLCHHPDFCAKQIWQKTPRQFAEKHTLLSASWNLMRSSFWSLDIACLVWNLMSYILGVNFCTKRRWQKTLQTFVRARCSLKISFFAADTIHTQG